MCEPLEQDESTDPDLERVRAWTDLVCDVLDRLVGIARRALVVVVVLVLVWGLITQQAWAIAGAALTPLLRLIDR